MKAFEILSFLAVVWFFSLMTIVVVDGHYTAQNEAVRAYIGQGATPDLAVCLAATPHSNSAVHACVQDYRDSRKGAVRGQSL